MTELLGAHVSVAGGTPKAPPRATELGATAMQIFTKQASRWAEREIAQDEQAAFQHARASSTVLHANSHDSYLINLASPNPILHARSLDAFKGELRRSEALSLDAVVSHPGNYIDDQKSGLARNADAITQALEEIPGRTRLLLEGTAGTGTSLGSTFEELSALLARIAPSVRARVGVCLDSCHLYAAGYDLVDAYDDVWRHFADVIGYDRLGLVHLNDSKTPLGSHRDRHELIAEGTLGEGVFRRLMTDDRLAAIPKVIEVPGLDDPMITYGRMLARLRSYML
jgi:deoxyribonuclease IV